MQNPPNSPDLAYPIETLWTYIKPRIKKRAPKNQDELKKFTLEEWNNIPKERIVDAGDNYYLSRVRKLIEIDDERLEEYHSKN